MSAANNKWDRRIDRARALAEKYSFATQVLTFYSKLTDFQKIFYFHLQSVTSGTGVPPVGSHGQDGRATSLDEVDLALLSTRWAPFLATIEREAPSALAEFARDLKGWETDARNALLRRTWPVNREVLAEASVLNSASKVSSDNPLSHFERFCAQAFLQPYAEFLADRAKATTQSVRRPLCPFCGSRPLVGVLRQEGDGAKRSLVCSFCRTEWDYLRIACTGCEERREEKLCVYTTAAFDCVRVEACDTCRAYINTVDLTRNGLAVPEVDDLAAIPLTLWSEEKGYRKVALNAVGL